MGMMSQLAARSGNNQDGYVSGATAAYPTTGIPASSYLGNNRRSVGGGNATRVGGVTQFNQNTNLYNPQHMLIVAVVLVVLGVVFWHFDNKA